MTSLVPKPVDALPDLEKSKATVTDHYAQLDLEGSRVGTWEFTDTECYRLDSEPRRGGLYHYTAVD